MTDSSIELLLVELFDADELRRFLRKLENSSALINELPGKDVSDMAFAHEVARLLERRGEIGTEFFRLLESERPKQSHKIRAYATRATDALLDVNASIVRKRSPTSTPKVLGVLSVVLGVAAFSAFQAFQAPSNPPRDVSAVVSACTIECKGCRGMTRAWIVLPLGEIYVVETDGSRIMFRCLPEGTTVRVIVEISDGVASLSFASATVALGGDSTELPATSFSPGLPDDFVVTGGALRRRGISKSSEPDEELGNHVVSEETSSAIVFAPASEDAPVDISVPPPAPVGKVDCMALRKETIAASKRTAWKKVMRLTLSPCWQGYSQALELRVKALREFGKFELCADAGKDSENSRVQRDVSFCLARIRRGY